jgi:hypothetical protein
MKIKKIKIEKIKSWKKPIKILKKPTGSVRFWFYKPKTEPNWIQTEKNRKKTEPKPSQTEKPSQTGFYPKKPNRTETGRFEPVSVRFRFYFIKKSVWLLFF